MFSKGVVLIFLILGLSSSLAHAIPHQNRAQNSCNATSNKSSAVLVSSPSHASQNTTTDKGADKDTSGKTSIGGKGNETTVAGNNKKGANPQGNGKNDTTVTGDNKKGANLQGNGKNDTSANDKGNKGANPQGNGKNDTSVNNGNNNNGTGNNNDNSLCLDSSVLSKGSESDGLNNATAGTAASLTSNNNFIDFCKGQTITSGQQIKNGSCNPIPMGVIAAADKIPSCKYVSPQNLDTLKANTPFTMKVNVKNAQLGVFTNADENYYSAPQQVNKQGLIIGHTHLVVEEVGTLKSTTPTDPNNFAFFKGIDDAADVDGNVSANVTAGLPQGVYRMSTIGTTANHAPFLVGIAQHGIMEDAIYVTVTADGQPSTGTGNNDNTTTSGDTSTNTTAAGKGGKNTGKTNGATNSTATGGNKSANQTSNGKGDKATHKTKRRAFSLEYRKD